MNPNIWLGDIYWGWWTILLKLYWGWWRWLPGVTEVYHIGLSENRVYPQWNSHLIGIMISKTIGFFGVLTIFRHTHIKHGDSTRKTLHFVEELKKSSRPQCSPPGWCWLVGGWWYGGTSTLIEWHKPPPCLTIPNFPIRVSWYTLW